MFYKMSQQLDTTFLEGVAGPKRHTKLIEQKKGYNFLCNKPPTSSVF